jgi:hypothetical protein
MTLEKYWFFLRVIMEKENGNNGKRVFPWNDPRPTKRIRELEKRK